MEFLYTFIAVVVLLNIFVSIIICKRDDLDTFQKVVQTIMIWLIPIIAALFIWSFHRNSDEAIKPKKSFGGGANSSTDASGGD